MDNAAQIKDARGSVVVPAAESLLAAHELHFAYAPNLPEVVCGASLALRRGQLAALIGANGSGKSSL
jgi:ABC-type bacteriocin/lantibiotic exporter with double-glycine peptidase domain